MNNLIKEDKLDQLCELLVNFVYDYHDQVTKILNSESTDPISEMVRSTALQIVGVVKDDG